MEGVPCKGDVMEGKAIHELSLQFLPAIKLPTEPMLLVTCNKLY
jgi:hypothetical protein